jgi:hypothetical protein
LAQTSANALRGAMRAGLRVQNLSMTIAMATMEQRMMGSIMAPPERTISNT